MPAARYWRIVGIDTWGGGDLELSELQLHDASGRVDQLATLTCSHAPIAGSLTALGDGSTAATARWSRAQYSASSFWLQWDFGVAVTKDVLAFAVGTPPVSGKSPRSAILQGSDVASNWATAYCGEQIPPAENVITSPLFVRAPWSSTYKHANTVLLNGGYTMSFSSTANQQIQVEMGRSSGKWYFEVRLDSMYDQSGPPYVGITSVLTAAPLGSLPYRYLYFYFRSGLKAYSTSDTSYTTAGFGSAWASGDVIGVAVDMDARKIWYSRNGVWQGGGDPSAGTSPASSWSYVFTAYPTFAPMNINYCTATLRTGSAPLQYALPAGFSPWDGTPASGFAYFDAASSASTTVGYSADVFAAAPAGGVLAARRVNAPVLARDMEFGGRGQILGTVKNTGTPNQPVHRRVRLLRERDSLLARETWSHPTTGAYAFADLDERHTYTALAADHTGAFNTVVASGLVPEVPA